LPSEPEAANPSEAAQAVKQVSARKTTWRRRPTRCEPRNFLERGPVIGHIWQFRFYDFAVFTELVISLA
jgi:hypothetical protein